MREIAASAGIGMAATLEARGHAELAARAATSYEQWVTSVGLAFRLRNDVYRLREVVKFHWEAVSPDGEVAAAGLGVSRRRHGRPDSPGLRVHRDGGGVMTTVEANGVTLGVEHFGDAAAPLVLLAGGPTMLSWPDALCQALARGGRHVVRYDLRDPGASTTADPQAPAYTLRDLQRMPPRSHASSTIGPRSWRASGAGGMVAQVAALEHPDALLGAQSRARNSGPSLQAGSTATCPTTTRRR